MELWDLYDEKRNPLHKKISRGQKAGKGQYHIVVGIWVVNDQGELLITLRAPEKQVHPNLWENTGGSVLAGETSIEGAVRELREETGIMLEASDLTLIESSLEVTAIVDQYLAVRSNLAAADLQLQPGETVDARWVTLETFNEMIWQDLVAAPVVRRYKRARTRVAELLQKNNHCL